MRSTWVKLVPSTVDVIFFYGRGTVKVALEDEIVLDCDDSYQGLPDKVQSIIRWALNHEYDYLLKCDDDVVLSPHKILASGFEKSDFTAHRCAENSHVPWGFNYWLSNRAMRIMATKDLPQGNNDEAWVAHSLIKEGIYLNHDPRYNLHYGRNLGLYTDKRPLRRSAPASSKSSMYFSWCMHNHDVPEELMQKEFKRVFEKEVKTQNALSNMLHI